jgi:hypothetical protein
VNPDIIMIGYEAGAKRIFFYKWLFGYPWAGSEVLRWKSEKE